MGSEESLAELRDAVETLVTRIDDLIYDELSEAVAAGASERPELERRLTRARNALVRALGLLGGGAPTEVP